MKLYIFIFLIIFIVEDEKRRKEYFEKLQKFQDMNDQKTQNFIKYMKVDPRLLAEERDKNIYIEGMKEEEAKWQRKRNQENQQKQFNINVLKTSLSNQVSEKK